MRSLWISARLAWRTLRRRPGQAALLLVTLTIATGTLSAGMWLYGSSDGPWDRMWKATNGFHVSVAYYHDRDAPKLQLDRALRKASALGEEPGVVAVGGPGHSWAATSTSAGGTWTSRPRSASRGGRR